MIINLRAVKNDSSEQLKLQMPKINLDRRYNYKIGVTHLHYKLDTSHITSNNNDAMEDNELISVVSNTIDLDANNTYQTMGHFVYHDRKPIQNAKPTIVHFRPLQLYEMEHASFELRRYIRDEPLHLKYIFLQLEILRSDAYGRLQ